MCGIVGYVGKKNAVGTVLKNLKLLEYRGYDSAGVAAIDEKGEVYLKKAAGRIHSLEEKIKKYPKSGLAIAHTRWATHGLPSALNAHPHFDCSGKIFVAHNGIIENYEALKSALTAEGHEINSATDTEVLAHLIERQFSLGAKSLGEAVKGALKNVLGTYGLAVISKDEPGVLVGARHGSPLIIGVGRDEYILASDSSAIVGETKRVIYLNDGEMVVLTPKKRKITNLLNGAGQKNGLRKKVHTLEWSLEDSQKGGFTHFMAKEIFEAPQVIANAFRGRILAEKGNVKLGGLDSVKDRLAGIKRVMIAACGTSYFAGLVGKYFFEEFGRLPAEAVYASEFRYRPPIMDGKTAVIFISQSGETADTLEALREAKRRGALTLGIINVVGSSIAREVEAGVYNHAGPEIAVASTKSFISQLSVLFLMSVYFGRMNGFSKKEAMALLAEAKNLPDKSRIILDGHAEIKKIARKYADFKNFLFLGRKYSWPVALEGALKMKEISYIHAEGYPTGEMKHGPLAMIDPEFPSVVLALKDSVYVKTLSNIQELKARRGRIIALATEGDKDMAKRADDVIFVPKAVEGLQSILAVIPLQLFAYYVAVFKGLDIDKPRNLAKSVTVE